MLEQENEILINTTASVNPPSHIAEEAYINEENYRALYEESVKDPEAFWAKIAGQELEFFKPWDKIFSWNYPNYTWFEGAQINITHNCLDRHIKSGNRNKLAYIYTNENGDEQKITYGELLENVCRFANSLKASGIEKGDRVAIYMPLCLEQIVAMLACARIGAVHSVIYAGFSAHALRLRIEDAQAKALIISTFTKRRNKIINLRGIADEAMHGVTCVRNVIIHERKEQYELNENEHDFYEFMAKGDKWCEPEHLDAEHPLYILYTSGTTGKPKGVLHTTAGYNLFTHYTTKLSFDLNANDVYWCTADTGWVTGHSYIVYGPLSNGATTLIYEGAPDYPDPAIWWKVIEKYRVTKFYTAPTAIRMFMKHGEEWPAKYDLSSLKIIGSVGEPINPEAWQWYHKNIGRGNCAVIDTWWQTETGGHMLVSMPGMTQKPGRAGLPFLGIEADVVNRKGESLPPNTVGLLVVKKPWPAALRTCYGEPERYNKYWQEIEGFYFAGDLATKDEDGYIMVLGRADDVLNVSGHRIGTAEVEGALVSHSAVAEAAVIGKPHDVKGESIKAFVILKKDAQVHNELIQQIKNQVRVELGSMGVPDEIEFVESLPKTRSGKIMRRVLKAKEMGTDTGDTSTLED